MTRDKTVKIRVSAKELEEFAKRKPDSVRMAEWLRSLALGEPARKVKHRLTLEQKEAIRQLARIGNNVNQLARLANKVAKTEPRRISEVIEWQAELVKISGKLDEILNHVC